MRILRKYGRQVFLYTFYILILTMIQFTLSGWLVPVGYMPDLILVFVIICGCFYGGEDGMVAGLAAGFLRDMLAGRVLGLGMLLLMFAGLAASGILIRLFRRNAFFVILQVVLISVMYECVMIVLTYLFPMLPDQIYTLSQLFSLNINSAGLRIALNCAAAVPMMFLLHYMGPYHRGNQGTGMEDEEDGERIWRTI